MLLVIKAKCYESPCKWSCFVINTSKKHIGIIALYYGSMYNASHCTEAVCDFPTTQSSWEMICCNCPNISGSYWMILNYMFLHIICVDGGLCPQNDILYEYYQCQFPSVALIMQLLRADCTCFSLLKPCCRYWRLSPASTVVVYVEPNKFSAPTSWCIMVCG